MTRSEANKRGRNHEAFSDANHKKTLKHILHPRHIIVIDDINKWINKLKLKRVGLTDILTWNDKIKQSEYIIQKIEEVSKTAIVDQDWNEEESKDIVIEKQVCEYNKRKASMSELEWEKVGKFYPKCDCICHDDPNEGITR